MKIHVILPSLLFFSLHADHGSQEQSPLPMAVPESAKEPHSLWLPITQHPLVVQKTHPSSKTLDQSIEKQIKKKIEVIFKPIAEDNDQ